jgi:hypothetical protein
MGNLKIKVSEVKKPMGLTTIQMLGAAEEGKVFVICKDLDWKRGSAKVLAPGFKGTDDGKYFVIIDVIVTFRRNEGLGEI